MESISIEQRHELYVSAREVLKIELRDYYAINANRLEAWRAGDMDTAQAGYRQWAEMCAAEGARGQVFRRVRVISEPLSDYQRLAVTFSGLAVEQGEDLRWLPRRLVSAIPLPGNDCFVLDGETAMFNLLGGSDERAGVQMSRDPDVVKFCRHSFELAYSMGIPHGEYRPE
jgi:uncharacterized protein DUF6879